MADTSEHNETSGGSTQQPAGASDGQVFRIGNVLKVVIPLALLGGAGVVFVGFFDGLNRLSSVTDPVLVSATGQIMYQGEPLEGAQITTRYTNGKMSGAIGWTDDQGRFSLHTDINGLVEGAYAGEHQVMITAYKVNAVAAAPPLSTPPNYASSETTPLRIVVSPVAEENKYVLTLEGNPPERPAANADESEARQAPGGGFDPAAIVERVFEEFDKNGDGEMSADEMQAIEGNRGERIRQADADENGVVDRDELLHAFSTPQRSES